MNQILSTERQLKEKTKAKKVNNYDDKHIGTSSIVRFFAIVIIIFGICITTNGTYAFLQTGKAESNVPKPNIHIERVDAENITIRVSSTVGIKEVTYSVNGSNKTVSGDNELEKEIDVKLTESSNNIIITAKDTKKQESTYQKTIETGPSVTLEAIEDEGIIKVTATSGSKIDYIEYYWDNEKSKQEMINDTSAELSIDIIRVAGKHSLTVKAVDINGVETKKTKDMEMKEAPSVEVTTNKVDFVIEISDEKGISKVEITFNGETLPVEENVNSTKYTKNLKLKNGENRVIITAYDDEGIPTTRKVRYELK